MFWKLRKLLGVRVWERRFNNGLFCRVKFVITWRFLIFIVFEVESETLNLEMHLHFLPQQLIIMPRNVHPLLKANLIINLMTLPPALSGRPCESILVKKVQKVPNCLCKKILENSRKFISQERCIIILMKVAFCLYFELVLKW